MPQTTRSGGPRRPYRVRTLTRLLAAAVAGLIVLQAGPASAASPTPAPKTTPSAPSTSKPYSPNPGATTNPNDPTQQSQSPGSWWVQPAPKAKDPNYRQYFILEGKPGDTLTDALTISNYTDHSITFDVYGTDGYNTPKDGAFALRDFGFPMAGVGQWIKPAFGSVTIPARTATAVPVTITIPANATPGDHIGGVAGMDTAVEAVQTQGNVRIGIKRVVAARLYLHVDGAAVGGLTVNKLSASAPSPFPAYLSQADGTINATVTNTGDLLQTPTAHITVNGIFGTLLDKTVQMQPIIPGQTVSLSQVWSHVPPFEIASVKVTVTDNTASPPVTASASTSFVAIPWYSLLILLLIIATLTAGRWYLRRRARASGRLRGGRKRSGSMRTRTSVPSKSGS
jgi:Bacterial protein of unknown function (DUF916)